MSFLTIKYRIGKKQRKKNDQLRIKKNKNKKNKKRETIRLERPDSNQARKKNDQTRFRGCNSCTSFFCLSSKWMSTLKRKKIVPASRFFPLRVHPLNLPEKSQSSFQLTFKGVRCIIFCHILQSPLHHFDAARLSRIHPPKSHAEVGCIHTMLPQVCLRQYSVKAFLI